MHIVGFHELTESDELSGFHEDNIRYTIVKLLEGNYIKGSFIPKDSGLNFQIVRITNLLYGDMIRLIILGQSQFGIRQRAYYIK